MDVDFLHPVVGQRLDRFFDCTLDIPRQLRDLHAEQHDHIQVDGQRRFIAGYLHPDQIVVLRADDPAKSSSSSSGKSGVCR